MIELGAVYPAAVNLFGSNGQPVNAATVTLTITQPDGTTITPAVTNPPAVTGQYQYPFVTAQAGRHTVSWTFTGPVEVYRDIFDVNPATVNAIISLADAKQTLGMDPAVTDDDTELLAKLQAITTSIQLYMHTQYVPVQLTEWHSWPAQMIPWERPKLRLGAGTLVNPPADVQLLPVASLQSLITYGPQNQVVTTYDTVNNMYVDSQTGLVHVYNGVPLAGRMQAMFTVGLPVVPWNVIEGGKMLIQHIWESRRGPGGVNGLIGPEELADFRHFTSLPRKVTEMLGPPRPVVF
jgi:hypothetical protein